MMRTHVDLRHVLEMTLQQARAMQSTLLALPEDAETMQAAIDRLSLTERGQFAAHLPELTSRLSKMREYLSMIHWHLITEIQKEKAIHATGRMAEGQSQEGQDA